MRFQRVACTVVVVSFLAVLGFGIHVMAKLNAAEASVAEAVELIRRKGMYESSWVSGATTHTVKTKYREFDDNETPAEWLARHKAAVAALQAEYPPG